MQKVRQILLFLERGLSQRYIERETGINRRTIAGYRQRFSESGLGVPELLGLDDSRLAAILESNRPPPESVDPRRTHLESLFPYFRAELKRVGVTRYLLWEEYIREHPGGYRYSRFCELFQGDLNTRGATMHFEHEPGRLLELDFAGDKIHYVDTSSGELIECPVLVAVFPFSGYGYVEALPNASLPQVLRALNNALAHFGGVPLSIKSDNMKQWVTRTNRYEPKFADMLEQWANHNKVGLLASRPVKPRDKPSVEGAVKIAYQRIYAPLRNETFKGLGEINRAIRGQLEEHHGRNFQRRTFNRSELFREREAPLLGPLPERPFVAKHYTRAKVQRNYHVLVGEDRHSYSVPFRHIGKEVRIIYCTDTVEIYHGSRRIALHVRSYRKHSHTTDDAHRPPNHLHHVESSLWDPDHYLAQAEKYGPCTREYFQKVMDGKPVVDQAYQSCLGLIRLARSYPQRIEPACKRALRGHRFTYTTILNIIEKNLDRLEGGDLPEQQYTLPLHGNIRGGDAFKEDGSKEDGDRPEEQRNKHQNQYK